MSTAVGPVSESEFAACLRASQSFHHGSAARRVYIDASIPRLHGILSNMLACGVNFEGATLDVASGWGLVFPAIRQYLPSMLPYYIAEMAGQAIVYDGYEIPCSHFECDKDLLQHDDESFHTVLFFDCLEHLIVDPIWTLLEFNRVLSLGGHVLINTPNAIGAFRLLAILAGENPATENAIKPAAIYQRHNPEWTPREVQLALECAGFELVTLSTNSSRLSPQERQLLELVRRFCAVKLPNESYGPEIFAVGRKIRHRTVRCDLASAEERWPAWLYSSFDGYRKRPKVWPVIVGDDYC